MTVFGRDYSAAYDALYFDKDYGAECDILESLFERSGRQVRTILDLGCGTGGHSVELARRGFEVVGVDLSQAMLEHARDRATGHAAGSTFVLGDIRHLQLDRRFDAVISMFAVVGYQISEADLHAAFVSVRRHLEPGGLFAFDVWYAPAVLAQGPTARTRVVATDDGEVERRAMGTLESGQPICTVSYELARRRPGEPETTTQETHRMRYFDEADLTSFLREAGLNLRSLVAFPEVQEAPSVESWNVLAVAAG